MGALTLSNASYIAKNYYIGDKPQNVAARDHFLLNRLPKVGGIGGTQWEEPVTYDYPGVISPDFSDVQSNRSAVKGKRFVGTLSDLYGTVEIELKAMRLVQNSEQAFLSFVKNEIEGQLSNFGRRLNIILHGDGTGAIGKRGSVSGSTLTLSDANDIHKFYEGQILESTAAGDKGNSGALRSGSITVTGVDIGNGKFTFSGSITSFADTDWLYEIGHCGAVGKGLQAWFPTTAPATGDPTFYGVDRSVAPEKLAGFRVIDSTLPITTAAKKAAMLVGKMQRSGERIGLLSFENLLAMEELLGTKVVRDAGGAGVFGFAYLEMVTAAGPIRFYGDVDCPQDRGYILDLGTLKLLHSNKAVPELVTDDNGGEFRLRDSAMAGEMRYALWYALSCSAPGKNAVFTFAT